MKKSMLFLLICFWMVSCLSTPQKILSSDRFSKIKPEGPPLPEAIIQQKQAWREALNTGTAEDLKAFYWNEAGLLWGRLFFQEATLVANQWKNWKTALGSLQRLGTHTVVQHDDNHYFEMGYYEFSEKDPTIYAFVTAWKMMDGRWLRELEVVEPLFDQQVVQPKVIDRARSLWVKRSNAHDPKALVANSYAEDAYYFNQGKYYQGTDAITGVYGYMSQPDWTIELTPKGLLPVQSGLAYELGEYKSNGTGHYVIIWELYGRDVWKVLLDFNF